MSTQRYISTSFWDDMWVQGLDPSEKLLYLYLMTNPLTNIAGVYKISERRISFDTGFNHETIQNIINKFSSQDKAYRMGEYIVIPSWPKHQKWETSQPIKKGIDAILDELSQNDIKSLESHGYKYDLSKFIKTDLDTPYIPPIGTRSYLDLDTDIDIDLDTDIDKDASRNFSSEWESLKKYWNNKGLPEYRTMIMHESNSGELLNLMLPYSHDEIIKAIDNYLQFLDQEEHPYQTFKGFMTRGIARFFDGAKPWTRYNQKEEDPFNINNQTKDVQLRMMRYLNKSGKDDYPVSLEILEQWEQENDN